MKRMSVLHESDTRSMAGAFLPHTVHFISSRCISGHFTRGKSRRNSRTRQSPGALGDGRQLAGMFQDDFYTIRKFMHPHMERRLMAIAGANRLPAQFLRRVNERAFRLCGHPVVRRGMVNRHLDRPDEPRIIREKQFGLGLFSGHAQNSRCHSQGAPQIVWGLPRKCLPFLFCV